MELIVKKKAPLAVVKFAEKRLEAKYAAELKEVFSNLINQGHNLIVLDIEGVDFIDSMGLGTIISALKNLDKDGDLVLSGVSKRVMSVLKLSRMDRIFKIFDSPREAVKAIGK